MNELTDLWNRHNARQATNVTIDGGKVTYTVYPTRLTWRYPVRSIRNLFFRIKYRNGYPTRTYYKTYCAVVEFVDGGKINCPIEMGDMGYIDTDTSLMDALYAKVDCPADVACQSVLISWRAMWGELTPLETIRALCP